MSNSTVTIQENSITQVILWSFCVLKLNILFSLINTLKVNFLKQVSGATRALEYTSELPKFPDTYDMPKERALDVFDFLHYVFGFQVHTIFFHCQNRYILNERVCFCWMEIFCKYQHDSYELISYFKSTHHACFPLKYRRWVPKYREFSLVFFSWVQKMGPKM